MSRVGYVLGIGLGLAFALAATGCTTDSVATTSMATSTSTSSTSTTSTGPETTTTVSVDQRIAEVTEIVRQVEFGWFDAIYRKDEEALLKVVARQESVDQALGLMSDVSFFTGQPISSDLGIEVLEILVDRNDCLAVVFSGDATAFRGSNAVGEVRAVFWPRSPDGVWRRAYQGDEWQAACDEFSREDQLP